MKGHYDRTASRKPRPIKFRQFMALHLESESNIGSLARCMESEVRYPSTASQQYALMQRNPQQRRVLIQALTAWQQETHSI